MSLDKEIIVKNDLKLRNEIKQYIAELEKKDKIIDLMARELYLFNALDCDYKRFKDIKCKIKDEPNKEICKECIKHYFEKKAEDK